MVSFSCSYSLSYHLITYVSSSWTPDSSWSTRHRRWTFRYCLLSVTSLHSLFLSRLKLPELIFFHTISSQLCSHYYSDSHTTLDKPAFDFQSKQGCHISFQTDIETATHFSRELSMRTGWPVPKIGYHSPNTKNTDDADRGRWKEITRQRTEAKGKVTGLLIGMAFY